MITREDSLLQKPVRSPAAIYSDVLDEMVVYCPGTSQALSLNESARAIWELCDGTRTIDDICVELANATGLMPAQLREEVGGAVDRLYGLGVLSRDGG